MRVALDTNILVYAEGVNGADMEVAATDLVERLPDEATIVPAQALGELYNVLVRKAQRPPIMAHRALLAWRDTCVIAPTTEAAIVAAVALATDHRLRIWDSVMLAVAAENDCRLLLSEDLQDGFSWNGVTVANPFAAHRHPLLGALLGAG